MPLTPDSGRGVYATKIIEKAFAEETRARAYLGAFLRKFVLYAVRSRNSGLLWDCTLRVDSDEKRVKAALPTSNCFASQPTKTAVMRNPTVATVAVAAAAAANGVDGSSPMMPSASACARFSFSLQRFPTGSMKLLRK